MRDRVPPKAAMNDFCQWMYGWEMVSMLAGPVAYDGMWVRWYLEEFVPTHRRWTYWHNILDLRSLAWAYTGQFYGPYDLMIQLLTNKRVVNTAPHVALEDARYQGELAMNLMQWGRKNGRQELPEGWDAS